MEDNGMDHDNETPPPYGPTAPITLKAVMESKEVGSIIGRKGEIVTRFREESGARINISSDATCAERLVTVTGTAEAVSNAYQLILIKLEEYHVQAVVSFLLAGQRIPLTMRLVIPAVQCSTLLSGNGQRLKEVRDATGAILQMSGCFLPHSTDRALIISGLRESIGASIKLVCDMFLQLPPKNEHLQMAVHHHGIPLAPVLAPTAVVSYNTTPTFRMPLNMAEGCPPMPAQNLTFVTPHVPYQFLHMPPTFERFEHVVKANPFAPTLIGGNVNDITKFGMQQLTNIANPNTTPLPLPFINQGFPLLPAFPNMRTTPASQPTLTQKVTVSNELIGCIIGKEGKKIAEIREASGALIHISNLEDAEGGNLQERIITISGSTCNVNLARYLIEMRLEEQRQMIEAAAESMALGYPSTSHAPPTVQCVQLVANAPSYNNYVRVNVQDYLNTIANQTTQLSHSPQ